jgi:hypothetical protein
MARTILRISSVALLLLSGACVSETTYRGEPNRPIDEPTRVPPANQVEKNDPPAKEDIISLPKEVMAQIIGFVNQKQWMMADKIEIDMSRIPFQASMVPVNDDNYVESVEVSNPKQRAVGMLMRTRAKVPSVERDFPRLRLGDGTDLVANREIQVRIFNRIEDRTRPVWIKIVGTGHASYRDDETGREIKGDSVTMRAEVIHGPKGPVFRESIR